MRLVPESVSVLDMPDVTWPDPRYDASKWSCVAVVEDATSEERDRLFDAVADLAFGMFGNRADVSGLPGDRAW